MDPHNNGDGPTDDKITAALAKINAFHPLYLHPTDNHGNPVVSSLLTGVDTYPMWSRAMKFFLLGKNKLGFVTGTCTRDRFGNMFVDLWERCNAVVFTWILNSIAKNIQSSIMYIENAFLAWKNLMERFDQSNGSRSYQLHREIVLTTQGLDSISTYFTKLRLLWAEYDAMAALPHIEGAAFQKHLAHRDNERLFQFLMGLNENFSGVKSTLLLMDPLPSLNHTYSLLLTEESQKSVSSDVLASKAIIVNFTADKPKGNPSLECTYCKKKGHTAERCFAKGCEFCKKKGHTKDICYKYKETLKGKGIQANVASTATGDVGANSAAGNISLAEAMQSGITFSPEQFEQFLKNLGVYGKQTSVAGTAPATCAGPLKWDGLGKW